MSETVILLRDDAGREHRVTLASDATAIVDGAAFSVKVAVDDSVHVSGPVNTRVWTVAVDDTAWVFVDGQVFTFELERPVARRRQAASHHATLTAPMPATVRKLLVTPGDVVRKSDVLIVLEAMKMELPVRATADGRVDKINCREGDLVQPGVSLIELDE